MDYKTDRYELLCGDNVEILSKMEAESVDSCVMDGPYGIGFMGKAWDGADIERVVASKARNGKRKGHNDSGESRSFAAGEYDRSLTANQAFQEWSKRLSEQIFRVLKPGGYYLSFASPRTFHRLVCGIEDAGFEIRDTILWVFASGFPKSHNLGGDREGWGSALKPAYEPICMARKPLIGSIAKNVEQFGTGAINIDASRIDLNGDYKCAANGRPSLTNLPDQYDKNAGNQRSDEGRWPANFIHDGSEEVVALFPDSNGQQGDLVNHSKDRVSPNGIFGKMAAARNFEKRSDSGSAARFFYCPKTSRADRNEGCEHLEQKRGGMVSNTSGQHLTRRDVSVPPLSGNSHPTVKPTDLMRYLVRMVTPPDGTVIDPCCGSGSTLKGAMIEGFRAIGIDMDQHNIDISKCRAQFILDNLNLFGEWNKKG